MADEQDRSAAVPDRMPSAAARGREASRIALLRAGADALVLRSMESPRHDEPATRSTFFTPRWVCFHVVTWLLAAGMVGLGWWQLTVSNARHFDLQNFSYWIQWWLFALFVIAFWVHAIRTALRPPADVRTDGIVVARPGGEVVLAGQGARPAHPTGAVDLVSPSSTPEQPMVYRGYVVPNSTDRPVRSHGDDYHDAYNDYLWEISLADRERSGESARQNER